MANCQIPCSNVQYKTEDEEIFTELIERHHKIKVKCHTMAVDNSVRLLLTVRKATRYSLSSCLNRSYRDQIVLLINFFSTLHITTTVIIDSLDVSTILFNQANRIVNVC